MLSFSLQYKKQALSRPILLMLLFIISACGQKGPLMLQPEHDEITAANTTTDTDTDTDTDINANSQSPTSPSSVTP